MKQLKSIGAIKVLGIFVFLFSLNTIFVNAQFGVTNVVTSGKRLNNKPKKSTVRKDPRPSRADRVIYVPVIEERIRKEYINITGLNISTLPKTNLILESVNLKKKVKQEVQADEKGIFTFKNLDPGTYKITSHLVGYQSEESEVIIKSKEMPTIRFELKQIKYKTPILIKGQNSKSISGGEVRFAPVTVLDDKPDDISTAKFKGGFCMTPINNGKAEIDLPEGDYIFVAYADEVEYKPEERIITIPDDIISDDNSEVVTNKLNDINPINLELERRLSTITFNHMVSSAWEKLPANWVVDAKGLKANGLGIALPKDETFRYYKDFQVKSGSIRLLNEKSIGFMVRALDDKNYYLIQITGKDSKEPYRVQAFIVKNGELVEKVFDNSIIHVAKSISDQRRFEVIITAKGNIFEVLIVTSEGDEYRLGKVDFENNNFPIGAVGIRSTEEDSSFEIGTFSVCNEICR